jgi:hypothetical protein
MEVSFQLHDPAALPPGNNPRYQLDRRLGGPQSRSGRVGEEKNYQPLPELEPPIIQPVDQPLSLSYLCLSYIYIYIYIYIMYLSLSHTLSIFSFFTFLTLACREGGKPKSEQPVLVAMQWLAFLPGILKFSFRFLAWLLVNSTVIFHGFPPNIYSNLKIPQPLDTS